MALSVTDIINFVEKWWSNNGLADNVKFRLQVLFLNFNIR